MTKELRNVRLTSIRRMDEGRHRQDMGRIDKLAESIEQIGLLQIAWRKDLEGRELSGTTIPRKLAALSSLFEHLCDANAVTHNPVKGVKRPKVESYEGKTPALGDGQARATRCPGGGDAEGQARSRRPLGPRRGVLHLRVHGKGGKVRYLPLHPGTAELVTDYLEDAGHGKDLAGALFRPVKNGEDNTGGTMEGAITAGRDLQDGEALREAYGVNIEAFGRPTLPRCRSGSGTPTSPPPGSTTGGRPGRRTVPDV